MIKCKETPTKGRFDPTGVYAIMSCMIWTLAIICVLGIANFAMHGAVLDCAVLRRSHLPPFLASLGKTLSLIAEFSVLLLAMLLSAHGWPAFVWAYLAYTALNAMAAWLILGRQV